MVVGCTWEKHETMVPYVFTTVLLAAFPIFFSGSVSAHNHVPKDFFGADQHDDFLRWFDDNGDKYKGHEYFPTLADSSNGASIHWSIDDDDHISVAVAVRATGWVGLGLSENGGMSGSDVMLFEAAQPQNIIDAHLLGEFAPVVDDCQNWELIASHASESSDFIIVEARRLLDTGDPQDRFIVEDHDIAIPSTRLILAWGDSESVSYHGSNQVKGNVRLYNYEADDDNAFTALMDANADNYFEMRGENHPIKTIDTEYFQFCFSWDELVEGQNIPNTSFSVIGFRPILDQVEHLHHFTLFGSGKTMNGSPCEDYKDHLDLVYAWARGEVPTALPDDVGMTVGPSSYQSFRLEIHYDNPNLVEGRFDSSGVRFYYTDVKRPIELGILRLGDPIIALDGVSLGDGISEHTFSCPEICSRTFLEENETVTIFREYLHMHYLGQTMKNELVRNGEVVHTATVDFFDFDQSGNQLVQEPAYEVQHGDQYRTVCYYDNTNNGTFGYSSQEEMCIAFLIYYPKKSVLNGYIPWFCAMDAGFSPCEIEYSNRSLDELPRKFGTLPEEEECVATSAAVAATVSFSTAAALWWLTAMMALRAWI